MCNDYCFTGPNLPPVLASLCAIALQFDVPDVVQAAVASYRRYIGEACSYVKILGMEQPVPLDNIYTDVRLSTRIISREYKTIEQLEAEAIAETRTRSMADIESTVRRQLESPLRSERYRKLAEEINARYQVLIEQTADVGTTADHANTPEANDLREDPARRDKFR